MSLIVILCSHQMSSHRAAECNDFLGLHLSWRIFPGVNVLTQNKHFHDKRLREKPCPYCLDFIQAPSSGAHTTTYNTGKLHEKQRPTAKASYFTDQGLDSQLPGQAAVLSPNSSYKGPIGSSLKINLFFSMCGACLQVVYIVLMNV